jgi:Bacterial Ig-like domain
MKKYLLLTALAAFTLFFVSCPEPLTEDIVTSALDNLPPTIEVFSPGENDNYYAQVDFSLRVSDDSLEEGDGKGDVASIEFAVSNDDFRGGKINISTSGSVVQDSSGGSDIINYDPSSGNMDFTFSTVAPSVLNGLLSVNLLVTDRNGNATEERVVLYENDGPWFDFTVVDKDDKPNVYWPTENVTFSGTVANSNDSLTSSSDIQRIEWNISNILIGKLIMDEDETYDDPYDPGTEINYYNSSTELYEALISGYLFSYNANYFRFDPSDGSFEASIYMKDQFQSLGTLSMKLEVEDKSGHVSSDSILLSLDLALPDIGGDRILIDNIFGFYSDNGNSDTLTLKCGDTFSELNLTYRLKSGGHESADSVILETAAAYPAVPGPGEFLEFTLDNGLLADLLADGSRAETTSLLITATNIEDPDIITQVAMTLKEDSAGPELENFTIECIDPGVSGNTTYASELKSLEVLYDVANEELETGVSSTLAVGAKPAVAYSGTGTKSQTLIGNEWSSGQVEGPVSVTITMEDHLGNENIYTNTGGTPDTEIGEKIDYYPSNGGNLTLSGMSVVISADDTASEFDWPEEAFWARSGEEMTLTINPGSRDIESISDVEIAGIAVSDGNGDNIFTSSNTSLAVTDSFIKKSYSITDKAGNIYSASDADSVVTYDDISPLVGLLSFSYTDDGVATPNNFLSTDMLTSEMRLVLSGLDTIDDDHFHGFRYRAFDTNYGSFIDTGVNVSSVVDLDDDDLNPMSGAGEATYTGSVKLYDDAGNSDEVPFSFILDLTAPIISVTEFVKTTAGTPSAYSNYAKSGDTVSLTFEIDESNSGLEDSSAFVVLINDETIALPAAESGNSFTYELVLSGINNDNDFLSYSIIVEDLAGNERTLTEDSTVMYYSSQLQNHIEFAYDESLLQIGDEYWATLDESVSFSVTPGRDIITFTGTFAGSDIDAGGAVDASVTKNFVKPMSGENETQLYYSVPTFTDKAGNSCSSAQILFSKTLFYDGKSPDLSDMSVSISDPDVTEKGVHNIKFLNSNADDDEVLNINLGGDGTNLDDYYLGYDFKVNAYNPSGEYSDTASYLLSNIDVGSGEFLPDNDGDYSIVVTVSDKVGNTTDFTPFIISVDKNLPDIDVTKFDDNDTNALRKLYAKDDDIAYLYFNISDPDGNQSGLDNTTYSFSFAGVNHSLTAEASTNTWELSETLDYDVARVAAFNNDVIPFTLSVSDLAGNTSTKTNTSPGITALNYYGSSLDRGDVNLSFGTEYSDFAGDSNHYARSGEDFYLDIIASNRVLDSVVGSFSNDSINYYTDIPENTNYRISDSKTGTESKFDIEFSLTITDKAGNVMNDAAVTEVYNNTEKLYYDSVDPILTSLSLALGGSGFVNGATNYVNENASLGATFVGVQGVTGATEENLYGVIYNDDNTGYIESSSALSGTDIYLSNLLGSLSPGTEADVHNVKVKLIDKAGNTSNEMGPFSYTVDTKKPSAISSVTGLGTATVDVIFKANHGYSAGESKLIDSWGVAIDPNSSVATVLSYTASTVLGTQGIFSSGVSYTIPSDIYSDDAGNKNYTQYTLEASNGTPVAGLSSSFTSIQADPIMTQDFNSTDAESYSTIRTYDYASRSPISSVQNQMGADLIENLASTEISELGTLKKAASYTAVPVSFRSGGAALEITAPERILEDLSPSNNPVKDVMDQIAFNEAEYKAALESLMTPTLSRQRLHDMEAIMEPELVEPEMLTVSATPFLMGAATEVNVVISDSEMGEKASGALLIQILAALVMALLSIGFVVVLKKMSKT